MRTLALLALLAFFASPVLSEEPAAPTLDLNVKVLSLRAGGVIGIMREALGWSSTDVPLPKRDQIILLTGHSAQDQLADGDVIAITVTPAGTTKIGGDTLRTYRYLADYK